VAITCPRLNEAQLRYAKCNMPHRTENSGSKHTFCAELEHSEDKSWKRPNDGRSHFGAANFMEVLLHDEEATEGLVLEESWKMQPHLVKNPEQSSATQEGNV
jgi:hypothetical protein